MTEDNNVYKKKEGQLSTFHSNVKTTVKSNGGQMGQWCLSIIKPKVQFDRDMVNVRVCFCNLPSILLYS